MLTPRNARDIITRLFVRKPIANLQTLKRALNTTSRTTVFRALSPIGYLTSYSHARRYYTLRNITQFDTAGLWAHGPALFSKDGTLRATIVRLVEAAPDGKTHRELQTQLRLRVHDTLLDLVAAKKIVRAEIGPLYLYVSVDQATAAAQLVQRRSLPTAAPPRKLLSGHELTIEVLLTVIKAQAQDPAAVVLALGRQGRKVSREQVEAVFARYGLSKKKSSWRRSRH